MRLNFSGVDVNDIVEGVRRIGKVVDEQVSLFSTFGPTRSARAAPVPPPEETPGDLADVVELPRRRDERRAHGS